MGDVFSGRCVDVQVFGPMERDDVNARGLSRHHIMQAAEQSLHRLNSDYIDLYQVLLNLRTRDAMGPTILSLVSLSRRSNLKC